MESKSDFEKSIGLITGLAIAEMLSVGQLQVAVDDPGSAPRYADDVSLGPMTRSLCDQPVAEFRRILAATIGLQDLLYLVLIDTPTPRILSDLLYRMQPKPSMEQALHRIGHVIGWGSESRAIKHIRASGVDDDVLPIALYSLMRYEETPLESIIKAAQIREKDRIAYVVGMITGLRHGVSIFPDAWLRDLPDGEWLTEIATMHGPHWIDIMRQAPAKG